MGGRARWGPKPRLLLVLALWAAPVGGQVPAPPPVSGLHEEALERRVEAEVDAALLATDDEARDARLDTAEGLAGALVAGYPSSADAWYWLAVTQGLRTEFSGPFQKLSTGKEVLASTARVLELDSLHAGGHEMMGRLHAAVMRLPWVVRRLALGMGMGEVLGDASWEEAERHYRIAVARDARAPAPRLELAKLLAQRGRPGEAIPLLEELNALTPADEVDRRLAAEGDSLLAVLREDAGG